jgi:hypothetical protein
MLSLAISVSRPGEPDGRTHRLDPDHRHAAAHGRDLRQREPSELPWSRLLAPLAAIAAVLFAVLGTESGLCSAQAVSTSWSGVGAVVLTVLMRTWFAISNARFLRKNRDVDSGAWACLVGMSTLLISALWEAGTALIDPGSSLTGKLAVRSDMLASLGSACSSGSLHPGLRDGCSTRHRRACR